MKKTFLISAKAYRDFLVEADTAEEAIDVAHSEYDGGFDWEVEEYTVEDEMTDQRKIDICKANGAVDICDALYGA